MLLGRATEELSARTGPTVGGLLNATLGNLLLVLGASQLVGGLRYPTQVFNRQLATVNVPLLVIAATGLVVPALFSAAHPDPSRTATVRMSEFVAVLLVLGYVLSLVYSIWTNGAVVAGIPDEHEEPATWRTIARRLPGGSPGGGRILMHVLHSLRRAVVRMDLEIAGE